MSVALPLNGNLVQTGTSRTTHATVAAVEISHDVAAAKTVWRRLESEDALASPYQSYEFLSSWQRHIGASEGVTPLIVTAYDAAGRPLFLWPLGYRSQGPVRSAQFLGGKHANMNFGLWQQDTAPAVTSGDVERVLARVAASGLGVDLLALHRQPARWRGYANPLLLLPHQPSPNDSARRDITRSANGRIDLHVSRGMRKQLRSKDRKLAALPGYRFFKASTPDDVDRLLAWFFPVKAEHLAAQGLANAFASPAVEEFVRDICHSGLAEGAPLAELHAIEAAGELLAVFAGIGDERRFSAMFNTYTPGPLARYSPGLVLLLHMIADLGQRGFTTLDLGVGDATYKRGFCPEAEPLFDSFLPLTAKGRVAAAAFRSAAALKREIKRTPHLWSALQSARRYFPR